MSKISIFHDIDNTVDDFKEVYKKTVTLSSFSWCQTDPKILMSFMKVMLLLLKH